MFKNQNIGLWVAVEGIDNVGKTTLARAIKKELGESGFLIRLEPEFGDLEFGQIIQSLVYTNWGCVPADAQPFVIAADRAHRYLDAAEFSKIGGIVVFDRHLMSSAVYQGVASKRSSNEMWEYLKRLYGGSFITPDLTFILDASIETVVKRGGDDVQSIEFLTEAKERFLHESKADSVVLIDAEQPKAAVVDLVVNLLREKLKNSNNLVDR